MNGVLLPFAVNRAKEKTTHISERLPKDNGYFCPNAIL